MAEITSVYNHPLEFIRYVRLLRVDRSPGFLETGRWDMRASKENGKTVWRYLLFFKRQVVFRSQPFDSYSDCEDAVFDVFILGLDEDFCSGFEGVPDWRLRLLKYAGIDTSKPALK